MYYIGVAGGASNAVLMDEKQGAPTAFSNIFGSVGGTLLNICIVVSCLGTLNGLMVGATRGMYAIAARGEGPAPHMFGQIDKSTNMTTNSSIWGLFICGVWLVYFYGANLAGGWFGLFDFDSSELPIVTIYAMYIPMFVAWMIKEKDLSVFKRFVLPILSIIACGFMIFAAVYAHGITPFIKARGEGSFSFPVLFYLIIFAVIMLVGFILRKPRGKSAAQVEVEASADAENVDADVE
jgi:APA family basic amino acid/polyamine antiporter